MKHLLLPQNMPGKKRDPNDPRFLEQLVPWDGTESAEVGIVGVPFDGAVPGRRGARFAPQNIREAFKYNRPYFFEEDIDLGGLKTRDLGDVQTFDDTLQTHSVVEEVLTKIIERGVFPVVLGGDHSLTYPCAKALYNNIRGGLGIINFDAHLDVRVVEASPSSGTPFRRLLGLERVGGKNFSEIGVRGFLNSEVYKNFVLEQNGRVYTCTDVFELGMKEVVRGALERACDGTEAVYVSLDADAFDQAYAPGVSAPSPGGLLPRDVFSALFEIAKERKVRAFDVMEVSPPNDVLDLTSNVAATSILYFIAGLAWRKKEKGTG